MTMTDLTIRPFEVHVPDEDDQTDIAESMDLENGLITHHRVYWGWVGFSKLHNAINKARQ
jgi:steroid Delta-isomerase